MLWGISAGCVETRLDWMAMVWDTAMYPCDGLLSGRVTCPYSEFARGNVISMTSNTLHGQAPLPARTAQCYLSSITSTAQRDTRKSSATGEQERDRAWLWRDAGARDCRPGVINTKIAVRQMANKTSSN